MKLVFRQKVFSILDSFDIFDERGNMVYAVRSQFDFGHHFGVFDAHGVMVGELREKMLSWLHTFIMYKNGTEIGRIVKEFSFFTPRFTIQAKGYEVEGNFMEWDYQVRKNGRAVAYLHKELFHWSDTYVIDAEDECVTDVLMIALAIDAVKCDHSGN